MVGLLFVAMAQAKAGETKVVTDISFDGQTFQAGKQIENPDNPAEKIIEVNVSGSGNDTVTVFSLDNPKIAETEYALTGQISYHNITTPGFLEMLNHFPQGQFFTRALSPEGPLGLIQASSPWRTFTLPFTTNKDIKAPSKIELNLSLPGGGTIYLKSISLVEHTTGAKALVAPLASGTGDGPVWWSDRTAGWLGAMSGVFIGFAGALIGICSSKGRAKRLVQGIMFLTLGLGLMMVVMGIVAVIREQPYVVYYPLLLGGGIITVVFGALVKTIQKRYLDLELRKMSAVDAGR